MAVMFLGVMQHLHRLLDILLIILIEYHANQYVTISFLGVRLIALAYLLPKSPVLIHLYFESTLMLILLSTYILTDEFINILCLGILLVVVTTYGLMNEFYRW
jgi:hypothetical protein